MKADRMRFFAALSLLVSTLVTILPFSRSGTAFAQAMAGQATLTRPVSILFMGTDMVYHGHDKQRGRDPTSFRGNSDAMMLIRLDPRTRTIKMIQIPRDTLATIDGQLQKINGANRIGGPALALQTVGTVSGVTPNYYVCLNLQGFMNIVEALGGVTVTVPKPMRYADYVGKWAVNLQPGPATLNASQAMGFVRFRSDAQGDLGRMGRQRAFIKAVANKIRSPQHWRQLPAIVDTARMNVETNIPSATLFQMAAFVRSVPGNKISVGMLPVSKTKTGEFLVNKGAVSEIRAHMM